jgi:hypothetical protein
MLTGIATSPFSIGKVVNSQSIGNGVHSISVEQPPPLEEPPEEPLDEPLEEPLDEPLDELPLLEELLDELLLEDEVLLPSPSPSPSLSV